MGKINKEQWKLLIDQLRDWQEKEDYTLEQIAEATGYREETINRVLNSKFPPKLDVLHNICKAMNVELNISTKIESKYRVYRDKGNLYVERTEEPRFRGLFTGNEVTDIAWIDEEPHARDYMSVARYMREAGECITLYMEARQ